MAVQRRYSSLQVLLAMALFYLDQVNSIKVTFGTNGGPIIPPTPTPPTPPPQPPFRDPAPVWEDQHDDIPNPNPYKAPLPPQLAHFFPQNKAPVTHPTPTVKPQLNTQTRYTHVIYQPKPALPAPSTTISSAKSFVQAYAQPKSTHPTQVTNYASNDKQNENHNHQDNHYQSVERKSESFTNYKQVPALGIKYFPGYGYKYLTPEQDKDSRKYESSKHFHNKHNAIESNDIFNNQQHPDDIDLSYGKYLAQRVKKSPEQQMYIAQQPFNYFQQQQLFFPSNYYRH